MKTWRIVFFLSLVVCDMSPTHAQTFPNRRVTIISPYQAGGTSDIIARNLAQKLETIWSQPVIVENRPGANGSVGLLAVARSSADGYTLLATASSALTINPLIYNNLAYDVKRDLSPISQTGQVTNVLVANPSVQAKTLSDVIALARTHPGQLSYASQGIGSNGHVNGELFRMRTGVDLQHVPYKGSAPAVNDLLSGQVHLMFDNLPTVLEHIRAGTLRAIAVTAATRSPQLPDVPTMGEAGVANFDTTAWFALLVAKNTPENIRAAIEKAVAEALADQDVRNHLATAGVDVASSGAAELTRKIDADTAMWLNVVAAAQIKVQ